MTSLFSVGVISLSLLSLPAYAENTVIKPTIKADKADKVEKTENKDKKGESEEVEKIVEKPKQKTLIVTQKPSETALSVANKELLAENNKLEREISDLQTQVNVLINERSGQLFLYGALTALVSFFIGGFFSWLFLARGRSRW